jgi:hypothetical protein
MGRDHGEFGSEGSHRGQLLLRKGIGADDPEGIAFTAQTKANEEPVEPPVYSTTVMPGRKSPRVSASSVIARAIRSLYEPVGWKASNFT